MRYIIYARKSTESEDRQSLSIASQIIEMQEIAKREKLSVVKIFQESKSAKEPGRPIFNEMLKFIEKGNAEGILCWKIDRLARNPVDEGLIKWMLQKETIAQIKTFDREYNPDDNVVIASIEFSMANQYIRDLSKNVKRGLAEKVRRGEYPSYPPLGYIGDPRTKRMIVLEEEARHIKEAFLLYNTGKWSVQRIADHLQKKGLRTRRGGIIYKGTLHRTLLNPIYCGMFRWKEQLYNGTHEPIISKRIFDEVQRKMFPEKFLKREDKRKFAFRGLMVCGECGLKITAEIKKGHTYYRCTKSFGTKKCSQQYIREEDLIERIGEEMKKVRFDDEVLDLIVDASKEKYRHLQTEKSDTKDELKKTLETIDRRKDLLVEKFIDNAIPREIYDKKFSQLSEERANAEEQLRNIKKNTADVIGGIETIAQFVKSAHDIFTQGDLEVKKEIAGILSSNFTLEDRKIAYCNLNEPFSWLVEDVHTLGVNFATFEPSLLPSQKAKAVPLGTACRVWRTGRDSNSRPSP